MWITWSVSSHSSVIKHLMKLLIESLSKENLGEFESLSQSLVLRKKDPHGGRNSTYFEINRVSHSFGLWGFYGDIFFSFSDLIILISSALCLISRRSRAATYDSFVDVCISLQYFPVFLHPAKPLRLLNSTPRLLHVHLLLRPHTMSSCTLYCCRSPLP